MTALLVNALSFRNNTLNNVMMSLWHWQMCFNKLLT